MTFNKKLQVFHQLLEGYTRQLGGGKINAKLEAAIKSGQINLPSSNTKSEAKK